MRRTGLRFEGYLRELKFLIKQLIQKKKFEIESISAPVQVMGKAEGYYYIYLSGYPKDEGVEVSVHEENKRIFERYCSTREAQHSNLQKSESYRSSKRYTFSREDV